MLLLPTRLMALTIGIALLLTPTAAPAATAPADAVDDASLLLLLDASRSMEDPDAQGEPKIDAARAALHDVIDGLDPSQSVGLRVFGGSVPLDRPMTEKCADSELVVPVGTDNADDLAAAVDDYAPLGETPIAHALQQAADDLGSDGNRTVVLVSDGIATCDPDPCEVAEQLTADGLDLVVHTVGLGADDATRTQLQCIAAAAGGTYYDATDSDTLTTALTRISTRAFRPFVYSGTPVAGTTTRQDAPELSSGQYTDTIAEQEQTKKFYSVPRTVPGSRVFVGATMKSSGPGGASAVNLRLETPDGDMCGWAAAPVFSMGMTNSFGTTGTSSAQGSPDGCTEAESLLLSLETQPGSEQILGEPLEIVVHELAPASNEDELPGRADDPEWSGLTPGEPSGEVVGGVSPSAATPVEAGRTVSFELVPGEIAFFSVPVGYGQGLEAVVEFPGVSGALAQEMRPASDVLDVELIAPYRAEVHDVLADTGGKERALLEGDQDAQARAVMPEVRWGNDPAQESALAGDHVVMVSLTSSRERLVPLPFTLTTNVVGEATGEPQHAPADAAEGTSTPDAEVATENAAAPTPQPSQTAAQDTAAEPVEADGTDGTPAWLLWLLGAAGALVAGAGAVLVGRRRA